MHNLYSALSGPCRYRPTTLLSLLGRRVVSTRRSPMTGRNMFTLYKRDKTEAWFSMRFVLGEVVVMEKTRTMICNCCSIWQLGSIPYSRKKPSGGCGSPMMLSLSLPLLPSAVALLENGEDEMPSAHGRPSSRSFPYKAITGPPQAGLESHWAVASDERAKIAIVAIVSGTPFYGALHMIIRKPVVRRSRFFGSEIS